MKCVVIYYDGNETQAKAVSIDGLILGPHGIQNHLHALGLKDGDMINAVIEVPESTEFAYTMPDAGGDPVCIVYTTPVPSDVNCKVLDFEECEAEDL